MRSPGRRRPQPRSYQLTQNAVLFGPIVTDGVSGFHLPKRFCLVQRGQFVDRRFSGFSRDRPDNY